MSSVARSACVVCHLRMPRNEMRLRKLTEYGGFSIGGSNNPNRNNSGRVNGRAYFRASKRWVCKTCWQQRPYWLVVLTFTVILGPIFVPIYQRKSVPIGLVYCLTLGGFGIWWFLDSVMAFLGKLTNGNGIPNTKIIPFF